MSRFSKDQTRSPRPLSRRQFLEASAICAAAIGIGGCSGNGNEAPSISSSSELAPLLPNLLRQPPVRQSSNGLLDTQLQVALTEQTINGSTFLSRTYEAQLPGPTLKISAGDTMRIFMANNLPPNPDPGPPSDINIPHQFNTTNLHTHGLHVSPKAPQDDVLIEIDPGTTFQFQFEIPNFHWDGTFFYHAHRHGSTSTQVSNGMCGALIVTGPTDLVPEIAAAKDLVMVIQDIRFQNGQAVDFTSMFNVGPDLTVNGQVNPTIVMRPGEVQRWRLINGGWFVTTQIELQGHVMHQIATDGITYPQVRDTDSVILASGNRADVLIQADKPGTYLLQSVGYDQGVNATLRPITLATVVVLDVTPVSMSLPTTLPAPSVLSFDFPSIDNTRQLTFIATFTPHFETSISPAPGVPGLKFDPNRVDQSIHLGAVEEWTILNDNVDEHPFHIHVNPFLLTKVNGTPLSEPTWMDTVSLPPSQSDGTPGSITFRTRFQTFTGQYVLHCHFLRHEDVGMMSLVEVI